MRHAAPDSPVLTRPQLARLMAIVLLPALLAGCDAERDEATPPPETAPVDSAVESTPPEVPETLADLLGPAFDRRDPRAAQEHYLEQERQIQEGIRDCMSGEGFDYVPVVPEDPGAHDPEEAVRERGFGITTWTDDSAPPAEPVEDPNAEIVARLDATERDAYREALYGSEGSDTETEVDPASGAEVEVRRGFGGGCEGRAYEEAYGTQLAVFEELEPALVELDARIEADPRIVELREDWSECMARSGFAFTDRRTMLDEGIADLRGRFEDIVGPELARLDSMADWSEDELASFFSEADSPLAIFERQLPAEAAAALAELQDEEISMAVADLECSTAQEEAYAEVSAEYEDAFIDEHRAVLERLGS